MGAAVREYIEASPAQRKSKGSIDSLAPAAKSRHAMTDKQRLKAAIVLEHALFDRFHGINTLFASDLGLSHTATVNWLRTGLIPANRVMDVVDAMNHELVTPEILRPDVYREQKAKPPVKNLNGKTFS
jgi:hypothetical protein